ncbi:MAG: TRAP transporter small permease [Oscillospiraceae bacterium]
MVDPQKKSVISRIGQFADTVETFIASVAFVFMCIFVLTTIVYRYALHEPISWTEEASRYLMITGIFIAMPIAVRDHVHLGVDLFINLLPNKGREIARILSDIITLIAYLAIDFACYKFVVKALAGSQTSPAMHIPIVIIYIIIIIGFILGTIAQFTNMVAEYMHKKTVRDEEAAE